MKIRKVFYVAILVLLAFFAAGKAIQATSTPDSVEVKNGDGTYDLKDGDKVILDNGLTLAPIYFYSGSGSSSFMNVKFDVYLEEEKLMTTNAVRSGWDDQVFEIVNISFLVYVDTISWHSIEGWGSRITFTSIDNNHDIYTKENSILTLSDSASLPDNKTVLPGEKDVVLLKVKLTANATDSISLDMLAFYAIADKSEDFSKFFYNVRLYDESNSLIGDASEFDYNTVVYKGVDMVVPQSEEREIVLVADVKDNVESQLSSLRVYLNSNNTGNVIVSSIGNNIVEVRGDVIGNDINVLKGDNGDINNIEGDLEVKDLRGVSTDKNSAKFYFLADGAYICSVECLDLKDSKITGVADWYQSGSSENGGYYNYSVKVEGLSASTKYVCQAVCENNGVSQKSEKYTFYSGDNYEDVEISNLNLSFISDDTAKFTWNTNIETSHNYIMLMNDNTRTGAQYSSDSKYEKEHTIMISGLSKHNFYTYEVASILKEGSPIGTKTNENTFSIDNDVNFVAINEDDTELLNKSEQRALQEKATLLMNNDYLEMILTQINEQRDESKENKVVNNYIKELKKEGASLSEDMKTAIKNFISYGIDSNTKKLGEGERAAVLYSYKSAYNKLPENDEELIDVIKIANGRWPSKTSYSSEKKAKEVFRKKYKKIADMENPADNAAITIMAYGLRQKAENRNLHSEKAGIKTFKSIFGYNPKSTDDWNIMQAITYSGAKRDKDSDKDFLIDERELILGTNPNNPDTDGDGYLDGIEVENGYSPL